MRRILFCISFFLLVGIAAGAQDAKDLESFVSKAAAAAGKGDFPAALRNYDKAISIVSGNQQSDLALKIDEDITDYVISHLAVSDVRKAKDYAMKAVELRVACIVHLAEQGTFTSKEEYIDNLAAVYASMGITLMDVSLLEDARQCLLVASSLYQQAGVHDLEYASLLRMYGIFQFNYLGDYKEGLGCDCRSFDETAKLLGPLHDESRKAFKSLLNDYARCISYLSLTGESGLTAQYREKGMLEPDYQQTKDVIAHWNIIRGEIISSYGEDAFNALVKDADVAINGTPNIRIGTYETDCLYLCLLDIAYGRMSDFRKASKYMLTWVKDPDLQMEYSDDIVTMLRNCGYPNNTISYLYELKEFQQKAGRKDNVERIDFWCSEIAYNCGNYDLAWLSLSDAVYYTEKGRTPEFMSKHNYARKLILAGSLADKYKKDNDLALMLFKVAEDYIEGNEALESVLHNNLSTLYNNMGNYAAAVSELEKAISIEKRRIAEAGEDPDDVRCLMWPAAYYSNLAGTLAREGKMLEAEDLLNRCLTFYLTNYPDSRDLILDYDTLMYIAQRKGDSDGMKRWTLEMYNQSFRIYLANSLGLGKVQRSDYWRHIGLDELKGIISQTALDLGNMNSECYDMLLKQKSFLLQQQRMISSNVSSSDDPDLKEAYHRYKDAERRKDENVRRLEYKFMYKYSAHREFLDTYKAPTCEDVRSRLGKKDAAVEFTTCCYDGSDVTYAALVIRSGWEAPKIVRLCSEEELAEQFKRKSRAYKDPKDLYDLVWKDIEPFLDNGGRVYFSPDGMLDQMNVEVISGSDGVSMKDRYEMIRLSSTASICEDRPQAVKGTAALYGGLKFDADTTSMALQSRKYTVSGTSGEYDLDTLTRSGWSYLPATMSEVSIIGDILREKSVKVESFTGETGTEESFKALSGEGRSIIHIATHGFYLNREQSGNYGHVLTQNNKNDTHDYPLRRCGLLFTGGDHAWKGDPVPDGIDDGILTGEEIAGMDLSGNDILVLSACQTGLGEITGDGVYGLRRAFKTAGAGTIVMSLWDVNDKAAELMMRTFYSGLADGLERREAFNKAIDAVKKAFQSPEYWAAFIMVD